VRAAIDISDGLGLDAQRLAAASGVDLELDLPRPAWLSVDLEAWLQVNGLDWRAACASGGDDYALLCAAPDDVDLRPHGAIRLGQARAGHARVTLRIAGTPVLVQGFRHGR
jgi:thiamine-monophosphate kinase